MNPEIFLWIFIGLVIFEYCFSTILDYLNDKNWKDEIPENLKKNILKQETIKLKQEKFHLSLLQLAL